MQAGRVAEKNPRYDWQASLRSERGGRAKVAALKRSIGGPDEGKKVRATTRQASCRAEVEFRRAEWKIKSPRYGSASQLNREVKRSCNKTTNNQEIAHGKRTIST
jgi:hypothetical protein